ncbi:MAG: TonB-dependent receptor, partial [Caldimonas sp.]
AALPAPAANGGAQVSAGAFNPAISLILNGTYAQLSRDPAQYRLQGFMSSGAEGPGPRGFALGESELSLSANIDPTFSGRLITSITADDRISVEEAVFERQGVFEGATLKAGRFLSSIGYLNSQHAHAWDFVDAPLAYQAFFGGQMQTDGLHLHWLAPTERYLELGAEIGAGRGFPGSESHGNGIGSGALLAHLGDDIGDSASWRTGVSYVLNRANDRPYADTNAAGTAVPNLFNGNSRTWVLDGIYKWSPGGNSTRTNLKLQGEYFRRTEHGTLTYDALAAGGGSSGAYRATQSGWYMQAVYQFMPQWRAGVRYDRLDSGSPAIGLVDSGTLSAADLPILQSARPTRTTLMVDYSLSEFSRFRLQLAADRSNPSATDRQLFLQYIMSLGAHGAHSF